MKGLPQAGTFAMKENAAMGQSVSPCIQEPTGGFLCPHRREHRPGVAQSDDRAPGFPGESGTRAMRLVSTRVL